MHRVVSDYSGGDNPTGNVKVFVRARPPESESDSNFIEMGADQRKVTIKDPDSNNKKYTEVTFQFDKVFWSETNQNQIFDETCKPLVDHVMQGYNCCCFAYGQTGSGKTYTMFGEGEGDIRGMIPRSVEYLFSELGKKSVTTEVTIVCSFLEIYNDAIRDLGKAYLVAMGAEKATSSAVTTKTSDIFLSLQNKRGNSYFTPALRKLSRPSSAEFKNMPALREAADEYQAMNCEIREDADGVVFVKDLSLIGVKSMDEVMTLVSAGLNIRATHETKANSVSSRSHTVFTVTVIQRDKVSDQAISGSLNLVDLAGSERLKKSESVGIRLKEALHINSSLTALGKVVMALDPTTESSHIPYRDSKLTRLLQNSLGGNSHTTLLAVLHPLPDYYEECLSTLQFANRCRNVRNNPRVNYVADSEDKERKIRRLNDELTQMRMRLSQMENGGGGGRSQMTAGRLVGILQKLGIKASVSNDGNIVIDGKKVASEQLGIAPPVETVEETSDYDAGAAQTTTVNNDGGVFFSPRSGGDGGVGAMSPMGSPKGKAKMSYEKMKRMYDITVDENKDLKIQNSEKKRLYEQVVKNLAAVGSELAKYQSKAAHKEFELKQQLLEKDTFISELKKNMKAEHQKEINDLVAQNNIVSKQNATILNAYPVQLKNFSTEMHHRHQRSEDIERILREEFDRHLKQVDKSRLAELANLKQQFEHWISERDENLGKFIDGFNRYKSKKSGQLRACEQEIICLYEYTMKLEEILRDCELGKYPIQQRQVGASGRPTTGLLLHTGGGNMESINGKGVPDKNPYGGVVIPKSLKPTNPLTAALADAIRSTSLKSSSSRNLATNPSKVSFGHLELSKRIVQKHLDRQKRLVDSATSSDHVINEMLTGPNGVSIDNNKGIDSETQQFILKMLETSAEGRDILPVPTKIGSSRGAIRKDGLVDTQATTVKLGVVSEEPEVTSTNEVNVLQEEINNLKALRAEEQMRLENVLLELQNNETWKYINQLESERERLHGQIKDLTTQLHSIKIANKSLNRTGNAM